MPVRRSSRAVVRLILVVVMTAVALLAVSAQAMAFTDADTETDEPETEETEPDVTESEGGVVPVEEAPPAEPEENDQPWTQRFLAPTLLALGIIGVIGAVAYYGLRIRGRYRVVD